VSFVYVSLDLARISTSWKSGPRHVGCPKCGQTLDLHQPDPDQPDRNLAICGDCKAWYLIDYAVGTMVLLPDEEDPSHPD
jgi:uncharacterized protein YbaR (Trm112 family)